MVAAPQPKPLTTRDARGKRPKVRKGLLHHWMGSVLVPGVELEELVAWLQQYSEHADRFAEIEVSKLRSRDGQAFDVFFRMTGMVMSVFLIRMAVRCLVLRRA